MTGRKTCRFHLRQQYDQIGLNSEENTERTASAPERHIHCTKAIFWIERENGAGEAIRTLDPNLGKVVLYP